MYPANEIKQREFKEAVRPEFRLETNLVKPRVKSVQLEKIDLDSHAELLKEQHLAISVTGLDLKDIEAENSPYSYKFGNSPFHKRSQEHSDYSCRCGELRESIRKNKICDKCGYPVTNIPELRKTGVTKMLYPVISPACYSDFVGLIGVAELNKILKYDEKYNVNGNVIGKNVSKQFHGMGLRNFIENYESVIDYYIGKRKNRKEYYNAIKSNPDALFTNTILYYSALIRPNQENRDKDTINPNRKLFESNKAYELMLKCNEEIYELQEIPAMDKIKESLLLDIQNAYNDVYSHLIKEWKDKKGLFRGSLVSTQIDSSARMVISPDITLSVNEVALPYVVCVKYFDLKIIRILQDMDGITVSEAKKILDRALVVFDKRISIIIDHILENSEVTPRVLVNRAPSLNPESIRMCKIICKKDIGDLTMGIPTATLSGYAGDYDGDSLLTIMLHFKSLINAFIPLDPAHQFISRVTGEYSKDYLFIKDMAVGLTMFYEDSKGIEYYRRHPEETYME